MSTKSLGIEVVPGLKKSNVSQIVWYDTLITSNPQDADKFIPLDDRISDKDLDKLEDGDLGSVSYFYYVSRKRVIGTKLKLFLPNLVGRGFFPFEPEEKYRFLIGIGLADAIQLIVAKDLLEYFGEDNEVLHNNCNSEREYQLGRLGVQVDVVYDLKDYVETIEHHFDALYG